MVGALAAPWASAFDFDDVAREADRVARAPYRQPPAADPAVAGLSYDAYRKQRFRTDQSTWRGGGTPFELQFFPLGRTFTRPLTLFEMAGNEVRPLRVPASMFEGNAPAGAAGVRLHRWVDQPRRQSEELVAFLGASYYRMVAQGLSYGLSARGLAVDTVGGAGEEFPAFTTFWFHRPQPGDTEVRFYALLESPRVTGAYAFVLRPGAVDVRARLTLREPVARLGIAPLTSMFLAGENQPIADDYRPEVHDSDGLQVASGSGEWLWRPLTNPRGVFVTSFALPSLRGFGLMQRDRAFTSYQDLEARYEMRPSAWIEPQGDWGAGRVELLQFSTPNETHDNVGAYWVPDRLPPLGQPIEFAWRMTVSDSKPLAARRVGGAEPPRPWLPRAGDSGRRRCNTTSTSPARRSRRPMKNGRGGCHRQRQRERPARDRLPQRRARRLAGDGRLQARRPQAAGGAARLPACGSRTLSETWSYALAAE